MHRVARAVKAYPGNSARKRVLIVNAYFDHLRRLGPRPRSLPQSMAPAHLAGGFSRDRCDVFAYNEQHSGPLYDPNVLGWPDMLVLTGLTNALDRMRQLTAYARSRNPKVIVVAGGSAVRALPRYSEQFFDYACEGDIEEIQDVIRDALGEEYVAPEMFPRFDLAHWMGAYGHVESSRNCNFHCSFCSMTAEGYRYRPYSIDFIRRQILAIGKRRFVIFIDNNFYGDNREFFRERMEMLRELYDSGHINGWGGLVTNDLFLHPENLELARRAGCLSLFSGVESFDHDVLKGFRKHQNTVLPQIEMVRRCFHAGISFAYGVILDFTTRTIADLNAEIEYIMGNTELPLPNYFSPVIPILQTPYFYDCVHRDLLLPNVKLRDLDTSTLALRPLDPIDHVAAFMRDLPNLRRYRKRVPWRTARYAQRYLEHTGWFKLAITMSGPAMLCTPNLASGVFSRWTPGKRTFVSTTEELDELFTPAFPVERRYESYFEPTMITDAVGGLSEAVREDLQVGVSRPAMPSETSTLGSTMPTPTPRRKASGGSS